MAGAGGAEARAARQEPRPASGQQETLRAVMPAESEMRDRGVGVPAIAAIR